MATRYNPDTDLMGNALPGHGNRALGPSDSIGLGQLISARTRRTPIATPAAPVNAPTVEGDSDDIIADDVAPDRIVDEDQAGLAHTRPDPARNGG